MTQRPFPSRGFAHLPDAAAAETVRLARGLLARYGETLMRIAIETGADGGDDIICAFIASDCATLEEVPCACETSAELPVHAALVLRALRDAWPAAQRPQRIAVVTDGTGLAFRPDDPGALGSDWLAAIVARRKPYVALVPFDPGGAWMLLTGGPDGRLH